MNKKKVYTQKEIDAVDRQLIKRAKASDADAFSLLMERYQYRMFAIVQSVVHDEEMAHDIVQESFFHAYKNIKKFHEHCSFTTWMYRICVNTTISYLRYEEKFKHVDLDVDTFDDYKAVNDLGYSESPLKSAIQEETGQIVKIALEHLEDDYRIPFLLRELNGLTYVEIAKLLQCCPSTVRTRVYRAREKLQEKINRKL